MPRPKTLPPGLLTAACAFLAGSLAVQGLKTPTAQACSCMQQSVADAASSATAIFEARITSIERQGDPDIGGGGKLVIKARVVRTFKGLSQTETVTLHTAENSAACGYPFIVEHSYLVYAKSAEPPTSKTDGEDVSKGLNVSLCSRTRPVSEAQEDLKVLGMGVISVDPATVETDKKAEEPATNAGCQSCSVDDGPEPVTSLGVLGLVGVLLARRRRR